MSNSLDNTILECTHKVSIMQACAFEIPRQREHTKNNDKTTKTHSRDPQVLRKLLKTVLLYSLVRVRRTAGHTNVGTADKALSLPTHQPSFVLVYDPHGNIAKKRLKLCCQRHNIDYVYLWQLKAQCNSRNNMHATARARNYIFQYEQLLVFTRPDREIPKTSFLCANISNNEAIKPLSTRQNQSPTVDTRNKNLVRGIQYTRHGARMAKRPPSPVRWGRPHISSCYGRNYFPCLSSESRPP